MKKMTDSKLRDKSELLKKKMISETCELIFRASVGRNAQQVADLLNRTVGWIEERLDQYAILDAEGGYKNGRPPSSFSLHSTKQILTEFAPKNADPEYVAEYESYGFVPKVAKRLAIAYEACENALDAKESK